MKSVLTYIDYRLFLRDYYTDQKQTTRHFSYRYFGAKAGISSPVFLKLVIEGKRNLSARTIERFSLALKLKKNEALYFKHLVAFNQAKSANEKQEHYAVLVSMAHSVAQLSLGSEQFEYLKEWYNPVIRELICAHDFKDDFACLGSALVPPIGRNDAQKAVELLVRLQMVERKPDGTYCQKNSALATNREIAGTVIKAFNGSMIELALRALTTIHHDKRDISGVTVGISKACYDVICAEIAAFKDRVATIVHNDTGSDRVYQLNIQLFPVAAVSQKTETRAEQENV